MDNFEKQKKILNKIIGKQNKVQVYDRATKSSKMIPKSNSSIKSANTISRSQGGSSSFAKKKRNNDGGCGSCSRKRKSSG